jgi:hypothetical protein
MFPLWLKNNDPALLPTGFDTSRGEEASSVPLPYRRGLDGRFGGLWRKELWPALGDPKGISLR